MIGKVKGLYKQNEYRYKINVTYARFEYIAKRKMIDLSLYLQAVSLNEGLRHTLPLTTWMKEVTKV